MSLHSLSEKSCGNISCRRSSQALKKCFISADTSSNGHTAPFSQVSDWPPEAADDV